MRWLIYGHRGWLASYVCTYLQEMREEIIYGVERVDSPSLEDEILLHHPDRIISLVGRTRGNNITTIDYLEEKDKLKENIRDNLYGPFMLAMLCQKYNIHLTYFGTGCIFDGYPEDGYQEGDIPDFFGSSYSVVKGFTDRIMHQFNDHVLNLRIRMPISADLHPYSFITKLLSYAKICSNPNSMSVLPDLLPIMIDMAKNRITGTINFTNPGVISHNEILEMYRDIIDPNFTWENFTLAEQDEILKSKRSNNYLNTHKLETLYPNILPIHESIKNILLNLKKIEKINICNAKLN